jgi:rubrerythrin
MKNELAGVVKNAIREEEYSYRLYMSASEKTGVASLKAVLIKLAGQEKVHKERLKNFSVKGMTLEEAKLDLSEETVLTPLNELGDIATLLKFAINLEAGAQKKYGSMAKSVDDKDARKLFALLAEQEKQHENVLKDAVEELGL